MPPFVSTKRDRSESPAQNSPPAKKKAIAKPKPTKKQEKKTLFDAADELGKKQGSSEKARKFLEGLNDDDDESSLSEADSDEFEDVPAVKRRKTSGDSEDEDDDDDEMDWQDAFHQQGDSASTPAAALPVEREIGDIRVVVREDNTYLPEIAASGGKKGPSKRERKARIQTHCLHVQWLMWHHTVRNSWINDKEVQKTLLDGLPDGVKREVTRWRESMGMLTKEELEAKKKAAAARNKKKGGKKGKDTARGRDWSYNASHLEQGVPDLSRGDPILRLLKILTAYWRKRFAVTAPGLRKEGYKTLRQLRDEVVHWEKNKSDTESHGERMETIKDFRKAATACEGSRDIGAQLFVALLRGLSLETRIVANLQPAGFGWSKAEEADAKPVKQADDDAKDEIDDEIKSKKVAAPKLKGALTPKQSKKPTKAEKPKRASLRGNKTDPISLTVHCLQHLPKMKTKRTKKMTTTTMTCLSLMSHPLCLRRDPSRNMTDLWPSRTTGLRFSRQCQTNSSLWIPLSCQQLLPTTIFSSLSNLEARRQRMRSKSYVTPSATRQTAQPRMSPCGT
jgi:xeroderma pigmentosum group C-complementing protein